MSGTHITPVVGAISFWLTVVLAAAGSALSALCIRYPVSEPKLNPYFFLGQWFIWLATPLLWGAVAASSSMEWLQPFDLLLILFLALVSRWAARVEREEFPPRSRGGIRYPPSATLVNSPACISFAYGPHKHHKLD